MKIIENYRVSMALKIIQGKYGLTKDELLGFGRMKELVKPRQILYAVLYDIGFSNSYIAQATGRDHTTVIHGRQKANKLWPDEVKSIEIPNDPNKPTRAENT